MTIDWWTLGLQTVNVLILIWILARFLFRPVARIIGERQDAAHAALDEAEAARAEAEVTLASAREEREAIAGRRAALLAEAQAAANSEEARLLDDARAAAETARSELQAELARIRAAEARAVADEAAALAADIAARLVTRLPDTARVAGFVDGLVAAVGDLPGATRAGIGAAGPVRLRAATALSAPERADLERRLAGVLGRDIKLTVETDPELIAGLELDAPQAIVRNHFRADLDRIKAELADNG
jgi:F-type H+-transporting ATPase subunit b